MKYCAAHPLQPLVSRLRDLHENLCALRLPTARMTYSLETSAIERPHPYQARCSLWQPSTPANGPVCVRSCAWRRPAPQRQRTAASPRRRPPTQGLHGSGAAPRTVRQLRRWCHCPCRPAHRGGQCFVIDARYQSQIRVVMPRGIYVTHWYSAVSAPVTLAEALHDWNATEQPKRALTCQATEVSSCAATRWRACAPGSGPTAVCAPRPSTSGAPPAACSSAAARSTSPAGRRRHPTSALRGTAAARRRSSCGCRQLRHTDVLPPAWKPDRVTHEPVGAKHSCTAQCCCNCSSTNGWCAVINSTTFMYSHESDRWSFHQRQTLGSAKTDWDSFWTLEHHIDALRGTPTMRSKRQRTAPAESCTRAVRSLSASGQPSPRAALPGEETCGSSSAARAAASRAEPPAARRQAAAAAAPSPPSAARR